MPGCLQIRLSSVSAISMKRSFGHRVEAGSVLLNVGLPAFRIPQLEMVANAYQRSLAFQSGELHEALRHENPPAAVHVYFLDLREVEPAKNACFGISGRRLIEFLRQAIESVAGVKPKATVRPRRNIERARIAQLLADS